MRAGYILAAVLLVLFLLGQIRLGGGAEYRAGAVFAWLRLGAVRVQVYPWKKSKKAKKPKKEPKAKPARQEAPTAQPEKGGLDTALDYVRELLPTVLEAAGQFKRRLQVDKLELELTIGADDPADAAMRYGQASAALGALWYPLTEAFRVKDGHARVDVDFEAGETSLHALIQMSFKLGQMLRLGLYFGIKSLRAFLRVRKGHKEKRQRKAA